MKRTFGIYVHPQEDPVLPNVHRHALPTPGEDYCTLLIHVFARNPPWRLMLEKPKEPSESKKTDFRLLQAPLIDKANKA
jgi:hypothetical protein